ncbi:MAG: DUF1801 domain-containing protein [Acidimicrobiales bacterium]
MTEISSPKGKSSIQTSDDWRDATLSLIRTLIKQANPEVVEERKWIKPTNPEGVPTWYHDGIVCTGEIYKTHVKVTFAKGASLKDPSHLFNSSLEGNQRRGIDFHEGERIDEEAFKALIRGAVALNETSVPRN